MTTQFPVTPRLILAVEKTFTTLSEFPHRKKIADKDCYLAPVEDFPRYLTLYNFGEETLEVLRVFRADLDWVRLI